jgi:hypothetical protein
MTGTICYGVALVALHECREKYEWWLNELLSLGVAVHRRNEFNDIKEIRSLTDNLKRYYYMYSRNSPHYSD